MLNSTNDYGHINFKMSVETRRDILVENVEIFSYLAHRSDCRKIVFIDPVVLSNHPGFLELESSDLNLRLVPTNLHESNKDSESLIAILQIMESYGIGRRGDLVLAVGGGALLDVVAMAASIFRRGISVVKVPTTLLGIVDASIGIKTGINFLGQRNRLGTYHFDYSVVIDPVLMKGLHRSLVRQGLGEIFKIAVIKSRNLYELIHANLYQLEEIDFYQSRDGIHLLGLSMQLMLEELHNNPREESLMRCVDFGHSFSPLLEMESFRRTGVKAIPHGYAVAYDCLLTSTLSWQRGHLDPQDYDDIRKLFTTFDFSLDHSIYLDYNLVWASFVEMTKHRGNSQNLPIPTSIGTHTFLQDVTFDELKDCTNILREILNT